MASLISGVEAGFEPIQGYVLRERIGSGGYGEVWLADAPGGLQKAVKFVYGSIDERAGGELRALQRIRAVHHPFILSLERIEVVEGQLLVVTELADGTLLDRFREFQQRGLPGIPRDRLLEYLRDTAEALDFLCQKHELQHLDIKPANLLLVADRVKVADFGLIKDIQNKSMSLMSGMTPTYASPEMFDGRPGRFSDQYSLAIVYQEMLTGGLPFHGRTTAQLATEHLQKAPDLDILPVADRSPVAKALAKKPSQRFASCREFIDELFKASSTLIEPVAKPAAKSALQTPRHSTRRTPKNSTGAFLEKSAPRTTSWEMRASVEAARELTILPPPEIPADLPNELSKCLFIGLGGTGGEVLKSVRARLQGLGLNLSEDNDLGWALLDIDPHSLQLATDPGSKGAISFEDVVHLPLRPASDYRDRDQQLYSPLSRRWLYNVPRTGLTEGVRPMGMLALLDNAESIYHFLHSRLEQLNDAADGANKPLRVYLIGSSHGGTGSVLVVEIAFLLQQILSELGSKAVVQAVLSTAERTDGVSTELATACSIACLREIAHYYRTDGLHPGIPGLPHDPCSTPPWDNIYLIHGGRLGRTSGWDAAVQQMSDFLCVDACTALGNVFDDLRGQSFDVAATDPECEWQPWLRTLASRKLDLTAELDPELISKRLLFHQLQESLASLNNATKPMAPPQNENTHPHQRLVQQQIDLLVSDVFREKQWTAQSWVRQCMEFLVPTSVATQDGKKTVQPLSSKPFHNSECNDEFADFGLDRVSAVLGVSLEQSQAGARAMLDQAVNALVDWTNQHGLSLILKQARLSDVFLAVDRRFAAQSDSLKSVAQRLARQRDELTQTLHGHGRAATAAPQGDLALQELAQQVRSLNFQATLHQSAAAMMLRLRETFGRLASLWVGQARLAKTRFTKAVECLARDLNIQLDPEGHAHENWLSLPSDWSRVRDAVLRVASNAVQGSIRPGGIDAVGRNSVITEQTNATVNGNTSNDPTAKMSPEEWLKFTLDECVQAATSTAIEQDLIAQTDHAAAADCPDEDQPPLDRQAVSAQLQNFDASLLGDGGAMRKILLLPKHKIDDESIAKLRASMNGGGNVVELDGLGTAKLLIDGERLDVAEVIDRLWKPNQERNQLAERLRSRSDVDWLQIDHG